MKRHGDPNRSADHEAAHVVGLVRRYPGAHLRSARITADDEYLGKMTAAFYPSTLRGLVVLLLGPLADPTRDYRWPPDFESALGTTREHLGRRMRPLVDEGVLDEALWDRLCAIAVAISEDVVHRLEVALVAEALRDSPTGILDADAIRSAMLPALPKEDE